MSEQSQGPGWWLASDGKWYPPQEPTPAPPSAPASPPPPTADHVTAAAATDAGAPTWDGTQWVYPPQPQAEAAAAAAPTAPVGADQPTWDGTQWVYPHAAATADPSVAPAPLPTAAAPPANGETSGGNKGLLTGAIVVVLVLLVGGIAFVATRQKSPVDETNAQVSGPDELPSDKVKLTDQAVVVRGNGGKTLKSIASDGTTFTLDGSADGVDKLQSGSVLLLTGVLVVKVTDVQHSGGDVVVKTEPAAITDLMTDGDISWSDVKASAGALHVSDPTPDDVKITQKGDSSGSSGGDNGGSSGSDNGGKFAPPVPGALGLHPPGAGLESAFSFPAVYATRAGDAGTTSGKLGDYDYSYSKIPSDDGGGNYKLSVTKNADTYKVKLAIDADVSSIITEGNIQVEKSVLNTLKMKSNKWEGKATVTLDAGTGSSVEPVKTTILELPLSVDYPVVIYGIPFNLNIKGKFLLEPAFTSKDSTLSGKAEVTFGGSAGLTYQDGNLAADGAITQDAKDPMEFVQGLGIGVSGMVAAVQFPRIGFGLGWASSNAGVYIDSVTSIGITIGSAIGMVPCKQMTITYSASAGVDVKFLGKSIPTGAGSKKEIGKKSWDFYEPKVKACELK